MLAGHTVASLYLPHPRQRTYISSLVLKPSLPLGKSIHSDLRKPIPFVRCPAKRNPSLLCACPLMSSPTVPSQMVPSVAEGINLRRTEGTMVLSFVGLRGNLFDRQAS